MPQEQEQEQQQPPQSQDREPGLESEMRPRPEAQGRTYRAAGKLGGRRALITGGESGIGRAVAVLFAKEGADVAISYLGEHEAAQETKRLVEGEGRRCVTLPGDIGDEAFCTTLVERTAAALGGLDILVNNAAEQHPQESLEAISSEQLERTFRTNIFAQFYLSRAAVQY